MKDKRNVEVRVKGIVKVESETEEVDSVTYRLTGVDVTGLTKVVITSVEPFSGIKVKDRLQLVLKEVQTKLGVEK